MHDSADAARRTATRIQGLADRDRVALSWTPERFLPQDVNDFGRAARTWHVEQDALVISDGQADLTNAHVRISGERATLVIASDANLRGARIEIASADGLVFIGPRARVNLVTLSVTGPRCSVVVGADTTWQSGSCLCQWGDQSVLIGDDSMLADEVLIRTNDGHGIFDRASHEKINPARSVVLEPHVWIGRRSTVNKGARVGTGSIVGSDSVVSGVLDAHSLYAGAPARKLRDEVTWSRSHDWNDIPHEYR